MNDSCSALAPQRPVGRLRRLFDRFSTRARARASLVALSLGLALVLKPTEAAPEPAGFREISFPAGPRIHDAVPADLNGDGKMDLIIVRGREFSIFVQKDGTFDPAAPDQRFNLHQHGILWDLADIDRDGLPELAYLAADGVWFYYFEPAKRRFNVSRQSLMGTDSLLKTASKEEVRNRDFFQDLDGDGTLDLLVPGRDRFLLYRGSFDEAEKWLFFEDPVGLKVDPEGRIETGGGSPTSQAVTAFWFPQPFAGDWNGDKRADVLLFQRDRLAVFLQKPGPGGNGAGATFDLAPTLTLPLEFSEPLDEGRFKLDIRLPTRVADVDGDGLMDVVATHVGRGTTYVFRGSAGRPGLVPDAARGDSIIRLPGVTFFDFLLDMNGDGKKDLILARTERPGLLGIVKILLTKDVDVEILFHFSIAGPPGSGGPLFSEAPDHRKAIKIPILFSSASRGVNIGTSAVISLKGDYDGDGRADLLLRQDESRLAVYKGEGRRFTEDPAISIPVTGMDGYRFLEPIVEDLNADGISDIILVYYSWDAKADRLSVLTSTKR
jgi:hypothetical protein